MRSLVCVLFASAALANTAVGNAEALLNGVAAPPKSQSSIGNSAQEQGFATRGVAEQASESSAKAETSTATPAKAGVPEIRSVLAHPVFSRRYACVEHGADSVTWDLGDALGTDCFIDELLAVDGRTWPRPYKGSGRKNEDWYGWHQDVLSPCTCQVMGVTVNRKANRPGLMGKEQASKLTLKRSDNVIFVVVHFDNPRVEVGDTLVEGQAIAQVGNNGLSRHPHIHIGAYQGSEPLQIRFNQRFIQ